MRRFIALAATVTVLALAGCAPEAATDDPTSAGELTPLPGGTFTASGAPSVSELDVFVWAKRALPAGSEDTLAGELLHAGEEESTSFTVDGLLRLEAVCAADTATRLSMTVAATDGVTETVSVPCATGVSTAPDMFTYLASTGTDFTVTVTATVDTAFAMQHTAVK